MKRLLLALIACSSLLAWAAPPEPSSPSLGPAIFAYRGPIPKEFLAASASPAPGGLIIQVQNGGTNIATWVSYGVLNCGTNMTCSVSGSVVSLASSGGTAAAGGSSTQIQFNSGGALGGISGWTTNGTTTITGGASSILNLGSMSLANLTFPTAATTGILRVTTSTGALSSAELSGDVTTSGSNAATVVGVNGAAVPTSATVIGTNSSKQLVSSTAQGNGAKVQLSTGTTTTNDCVKFDANGNTVDSGSACAAAAVTSVSNSDSTLTISPTTGAVVASLNLGHANTWTAAQTLPSPIFTGTADASGATQFKLPVTASFASAANGEVGYDSTAKNWHVWQNGVDVILAPLAAGFVSGDCGEPSSTAGVWQIVDAGSPCGSGSGGTFAGLTPGTNTSTTPFSVAPGSAVGGTTANFSFLGPASDTNTATVVNIDTGASSTQPSFRVGVQGTDAFKIIEITGPNQQTISGACSATPSTSSDVARFIKCTTSAGVTGIRSLDTTAGTTGTGIQAEQTAAVGAGRTLFSARAGVNTDGTIGTGTQVFSISDAGVADVHTGFTIAGAATNNHVLCGNGTNYVDCSTLPLAILATQAADTVVINATGTNASPTAVSLAGLGGTNSCAGTSNALTYNSSTHAFGCNSSTGTGTVNAGTANQIAYYASSTNAVSSDSNLADNGTSLTYTGTNMAAAAYTGTSSNGGLVGTEGTGVNATFGVGLSGFYWDSSNNHGLHANYNNVDIGMLIGGGSSSVTSGDLPSYSSTKQYQLGDSGIAASTVVTATATAGGAGQFPVSNGTTNSTTFRVLAVADLPISGTSPIAISGGGAISITGAAGQILAGASPAFTATPALGTDNSVAGTLQLANGSAAAHTIFASGATTTNTIKGFTVAPTTGDLVSCTTASTTCTMTDAGFLATNVVRKDTTNTGAAAMTLDMSASTTGNALKIPSQAGLSSNGTSSIAYDTTGKLTHIPTNGADSTAVAETTTSTTTTNVLHATATAGVYSASAIANADLPAVNTVVDTSTPVTVSTTLVSEIHFNENATAATAITYNLPTAAAGKQFCVSNANNGSAANTGTLELLTSATGQFIIYTDGTLSATGGFVQSSGAAADAACVVGVDSTHWMLYVNRGTWTKH